VKNFKKFVPNSIVFLGKKPTPPPPPFLPAPQKDPYMVQVGSKKMQGHLNSFLSYILIAKFG